MVNYRNDKFGSMRLKDDCHHILYLNDAIIYLLLRSYINKSFDRPYEAWLAIHKRIQGGKPLFLALNTSREGTERGKTEKKCTTTLLAIFVTSHPKPQEPA